MIINWTNLKRDSHVKLTCECEGFVKSIHFERDPLLSGFVLLYTIRGCHKRENCRDHYSSGGDALLYFFNGSLAEEAMPAEEVHAPTWWYEVQSNKTKPELKLP